MVDWNDEENRMEEEENPFKHSIKHESRGIFEILLEINAFYTTMLIFYQYGLSILPKELINKKVDWNGPPYGREENRKGNKPSIPSNI